MHFSVFSHVCNNVSVYSNRCSHTHLAKTKDHWIIARYFVRFIFFSEQCLKHSKSYYNFGRWFSCIPVCWYNLSVIYVFRNFQINLIDMYHLLKCRKWQNWCCGEWKLYKINAGGFTQSRNMAMRILRRDGLYRNNYQDFNRFLGNFQERIWDFE